MIFTGEMFRFWSLLVGICFTLAAFCGVTVGSGRNSSNKLWKTLDGNAPLVIANGGFSGLFPDSSDIAYKFAGLVSVPDVIFWCDVQLVKDGSGICFPRLTLDNGSDISLVYKDKQNTYTVNGESVQGYFPMDFTLDELANISLRQDILSRYNVLYGTPAPILTVDDVAQQLAAPGLWLNIQHDKFYTKQKLSMRSFVLSMLKNTIVNYISSPEVNFLRSLLARKPARTNLIFRFMGKNEVEPSTNQSYGSLLANLTFIKTFASGILVPKTYIWPVDEKLYLLPHSSIVSDAHRAGLKVFASDFANDAAFAYDYSYDPLAEYLNFIDNGNFSVDGIVSDFPVTPSEAIGCFSHMGKNAPEVGKFLVISSLGSSGDYPGCTDLAYQKAISDGVDVLDCPVQMSKDGVPICLGSINLISSTTIAQSIFSNLTASVPELGTGIYTFSLAWSQIQNLTAAISNPYAKNFGMYRNPKFGNDGKFLTLTEFLVLANNATSVSSVLISIENAAYLAEKQGLGITDAVLDALRKINITKKVMIQSSNSSVLNKFKKSNYDLVYKVNEDIRDIDKSTISDIKKFANSVVISKSSIFPAREAFLTGMTDIVPKLQASNLSVYVDIFRNEFVSQAWDFYSDASAEINNYIQGAEINGVVTEFPATSARYKRNRCLKLGDKAPAYMNLVQPGGLLQLMSPEAMPPAHAPNPVLTESNVVEPPLPLVAEKTPTLTPTAAPNGQPKARACVFLPYFALILATLALLWE